MCRSRGAHEESAILGSMNDVMKHLHVCLSLLLLTLGAPLAAVEPDAEAQKARAAIRVPAGLKLELFAAEPQLNSPVAITVDERGRVFVAEEYRFNRGTEENRTRPFLLEDDLQLQTVD